jgi:hypothetical protein
MRKKKPSENVITQEKKTGTALFNHIHLLITNLKNLKNIRFTKV